MSISSIGIYVLDVMGNCLLSVVLGRGFQSANIDDNDDITRPDFLTLASIQQNEIRDLSSTLHRSSLGLRAPGTV